MISRRLKAAFYKSMALPMAANAVIYKQFRAPRSGLVKVHLGPGQKKYLDGWVNLDSNFISAKIDVWANIEQGLPFRDGTVDAFYSHHVIEHFADSRLPWHFREIYRCLKPGGVFRVGGPNGDSACKKFIEQDSAWFDDYPEKRQSIGGRFANFILCKGEHFTILTESYLREILTPIGFADLHPCKPVSETAYPQIFDQQLRDKEYESTPEVPHTLLLEGRKPA